MRTRRALAVMLRIVLLAILVLGLLGVAVVSSWRLTKDEPLRPQVRQYLTTPLVPPSRDNGYFLIIGFGVAEDVDPELAGRRYVAAHDRLLASQKSLDYFDGEAALASPTLELPAEKPCAATSNKSLPSCLGDYRRNAALVRRQLEELAPYLERYRRLRSYHEFVAPFSRTSAQSSNPGLAIVMRMGDLMDASIALRMEAPSQRAGALRDLAEEVAFWRQFVGKTDWVLSQMIAARMLTFKLMLASELMEAHPGIVREHADIVSRITEPIRADEATLAGAIRMEMRFLVGNIRELASTDDSGLWPAYGSGLVDRFMGVIAPVALAGAFKPQATLNDYVTTMQAFVSAAQRPPARFPEAVAGANELRKANSEFRLRDIFFNPLGRLFVQAAVGPDFSSYTYRLWDTVALSRLVELQRRLVLGSVPADGVAAASASWARELGDLYTGDPARWDSASGAIFLESRGKRFTRDGRVSVTYRP